MSNSNSPGNLLNVSSYTIYSQIASVVTLCSCNFLDVIKTRLIADVSNCDQNHFKSKSLRNLFTKLKIQEQPSYIRCRDCLPTRSSLHTFYYLLRSEGIKYTFLSGIDKVITGNILRNGIFYPVFEYSKAFILSKTDSKHKEVISSAGASFVGRTITSIATFPFEISRIRNQSKQFNQLNNKLRKAFVDIMTDRSIYKATFVNFYLRELFFSLVFWTSFELNRIALNLKSDDIDQNASGKALAAIISGFLASMITYPYDVLQTNRAISVDKFKDKSSSEIIKKMYRENGLAFIINGLSARVIRGGLSCGIFFYCYEHLKVRNFIQKISDY